MCPRLSLLSLAVLAVSADAFFHALIPETRRGRATIAAALNGDEPEGNLESLRIDSDADPDTEILRSLIASVMEEAAQDGEVEEEPIIEVCGSV